MLLSVQNAGRGAARRQAKKKALYSYSVGKCTGPASEQTHSFDIDTHTHTHTHTHTQASLNIAAFRSMLFNVWLAARVRDGLFGELIAGDIVHDTGSVVVRGDGVLRACGPCCARGLVTRVESGFGEGCASLVWPLTLHRH